MNLKDLKTPSTVEEAVEILYETLTDDDKYEIIKLESSDALHHTLGRHLRNGWSFWQDTPLKRDFIDRYKLFGHGDDISGVILAGLFSKCTDKDVKETIDKCVERYRKHWINSNICPLLGQPLDMEKAAINYIKFLQ